MRTAAAWRGPFQVDHAAIPFTTSQIQGSDIMPDADHHLNIGALLFEG